MPCAASTRRKDAELNPSQRQQFAEFAAVELPRLQALAFALTGSQHAADDLVQATFERLYGVWPRIRTDDPFRYARQVLIRRNVSDHRRPWIRRESLTAVSVDHATADTTDPVSERIWLTAVLAGLPERQRRTVVLRYLEDLSVDEVATILNCSTGTVKRASHDGLANLRRTLADISQEVQPS